jgi:two-component system phosphate regulon sensor histidine kinase PhoR
MEPGVPFALLGSVTLLTVAAWLALAGAAVALGRRRRVVAALVVVGALVLAGVEIVTALRSGRAASDLLPTARTAGLLLVAAGLYAGSLAARSTAEARRGLEQVGGVVVPLAAAPGPAALAAGAGLAAAQAARRARRDVAGALLAGGLLVAGAASALAPVADDGSAQAIGVLAARAAGAVLVIAGLVVLARASLLGKVVAAIMAGVLAMAAAAVGVVGTTVATAFEREQAEVVEDAAAVREQLLRQVLDRNAALAPIVAEACTRAPAACQSVVDQVSAEESAFALLVPADGTPQVLAGTTSLSAAEALGLAGGGAVRTVLDGGVTPVGPVGLQTPVRLTGVQPGLALVVVVPRGRPTPTSAAPSAFVYGTRLDDALVGRDVATGGYGLSLVVGDELVASSAPVLEQQRVRRIAAETGGGRALPPSGVTVAAEGRNPTVHLRPLTAYDGEPVGALAVSRDAEETTRAQRQALQVLLVTALVTTALVGGLAVLLGRRTVDPVRRLTAAAERVSAGDLTTTAGQGGRDEVGTLSRTFDAMTGSLARLTGDLRASSARLETVLSSMSDGLVATDGAGCVTSINPAALAMAGLDEPAAAVGRPVREVLDVRDVTGARRELTPALQDTDGEVHRADGTTTPVQLAVAPLETGEGVVVVLRDTAREREVERMKTEFLSNVSHELRTPLTPIRGYADMLASRPGLTPAQVTAFAGTILTESVKMNRVVDLLVDVAAIEAGRVTTSPRPVDARDLLDARIEHWRRRAPERADDLRRRVASRLPRVLVDPTWVGKALDELVDNAVKYTPPGTAITLTAAAGGAGAVRVAVRDAGPGIAPADQEALFSSFAQVDGSATRRVGGLGLGLSFVRRLAEDAGYPLTVTSTVGKGTEFALDLPAAEAPPQPPPPAVRRRRSVTSAKR